MDNKPAYLYRVIHRESGKDYVGVTNNLEKRFADHRRAKSGHPYFYRAMRKYGPDAFDWIVITKCRNWHIAASLEKWAIALGMGAFNLTDGGEACPGHRHSDETKQKMRERKLGKPSPNKGLIRTPEQRANISKGKKGRPMNPEALEKLRTRMAAKRGKPRGWAWTEEQRKAIGEKQKGRVISEETKAKLKIAQQARRAREALRHQEKIDRLSEPPTSSPSTCPSDSGHLQPSFDGQTPSDFPS